MKTGTFVAALLVLGFVWALFDPEGRGLVTIEVLGALHLALVVAYGPFWDAMHRPLGEVLFGRPGDAEADEELARLLVEARWGAEEPGERRPMRRSSAPAAGDAAGRQLTTPRRRAPMRPSTRAH